MSKFKCDRASNTARGSGYQRNLTSEGTWLVISIATCNVRHFETPVFRITAHNRGIDPHNHVAPNRTGAEARRENSHGTVNPAFAHGVMDGHQDTRGRGVAHPLDVEKNPIA